MYTSNDWRMGLVCRGSTGILLVHFFAVGNHDDAFTPVEG